MTRIYALPFFFLMTFNELQYDIVSLVFQSISLIVESKQLIYDILIIDKQRYAKVSSIYLQ